MPEDNASTQRAATRRLAAIMFMDIVGFSRQMGADEVRMLKVLAVHNQVIHTIVIRCTGSLYLRAFAKGMTGQTGGETRVVPCWWARWRSAHTSAPPLTLLILSSDATVLRQRNASAPVEAQRRP
jgi:hypothetical protein